MSRRFGSMIGPLLSVAAISLSAAPASACSVPVFRYALERWQSDAYRVVIFHRGPLSKAQKALVDDMGPYGTAGEKSANLRVKTVDLAGKPDKEMLELWNSQKSSKPQLPWMVVRYPNVVRYAPAWTGPLSKTAVAALIDSPVRREIAKRILSGETTVWILLENGDKKADDAAYAELKKQLTVAEKTLKLPEIDENDLAGDAAAAEVAKLKIRFSIIRVSRKDPKEKMLVEMLLGSEGGGKDSLRDAEFVNQTMAFPIFGRGRIRYGLVGKGIAKDTILEACAYLTGPCKCQIKQGVENRGMDLVMAIDWNRMVTSTIKDKPAPPLLGVGGLKTKTPTLRTGDNLTDPPVIAVKPIDRTTGQKNGTAEQTSGGTSKRKPEVQQPTGKVVKAVPNDASAEKPATLPAADSGPSKLLRNVGILFGILILIIIGGSLFLRSKNA